MEETRKIYPDLNAQVKLTLSDGEKDCLKNRSDMIKNKKKEIEEKIKHYEKLSKRYARVKTALVATGITLGSIAGIAGCVISVYALPMIIPIIVGITGAISGSLPEIAALSFIKMKKNKFDKKVRIHTKYLNQLRHFYQKAIDDGLITKEEMSEYSTILEEYEKEVSGVKDGK